MITHDIKKAVATLNQGELVAIPTETVYGLAADAKNPSALKKIFETKGRPIDHPLIVHIGDILQLNEWAVDVSDKAMILAEAFWPGPLTLILNKASHVSDIITGGQDTIGVRIPNHPIALELLHALGSGVAAPSANRFGRISPTTALAVAEELEGKIHCILEGGQCDVGVESTIVDVSGDEIRILRPGMITAQQIEDVLHQRLSSSNQKKLPRVSGALASHYAPVTQVTLLDKEKMAHVVMNLSESEKPVAVMGFTPQTSSIDIFYQLMPHHPAHYAHDLYSTLRQLDKLQFKHIFIEKVPSAPEWDAIRDRLQRAAH